MKARSALSAHRALGMVGSALGWPAAAAIVGRALRTCQDWADPDTPAFVRLDDALALDLAYTEATGALPPMLTWYRASFELAAAERRLSCPPCAVESVARHAVESGEATAALAHAAMPGAPIAIVRKARKEGGEALEALLHAMAGLPDMGPAR